MIAQIERGSASAEPLFVTQTAQKTGRVVAGWQDHANWSYTKFPFYCHQNRQGPPLSQFCNILIMSRSNFPDLT